MHSRLHNLVIALATLLLACSSTLAQSVNADGEGIRVFERAYFEEFDPITARDMIGRMPGFDLQEQEGGRGLSGVRSNLLINGERPPPKGQSLQQILAEIPVDNVVLIELIDTGARLDIDMQGYAQVVNVVTREDAPAYYEVISEVRRTGTGDIEQQNERNIDLRATGSVSLGPHELTMRANVEDRTNRSPSDFVAIDPANPVQRVSSVNSFERNGHGIELSALFALPAESSLSFDTALSKREASSSPYLQLDSDPQNAVIEASSGDENQRDVSAEYRRSFASRGNIMLAAVDTFREDQSVSSLATNGSVRSSTRVRESGETAARALLTQTPADRLTVRTTATTAFNYLDGDFRIFDNGVEVPVAGSDSRVEENRHSIETAIDWNFTSRWTFRSAIGAEAYEIDSGGASSDKQTDPTGTLAVTYRPQPRTTLTLESRREVGQLSFGQFLASSNLSSEILTAGATTLEPERQWNHSLVYDRRFGDLGVMNLSLSHQKTDNPVRSVALSDSIIVSQNTSPQTVDRVRAQVDFPFENFGREDLVLSMEAMIADSETVDPVTGETREVSGVPRRMWGLGLRRDPGDTRLSWGFNFFRFNRGDDYSVRLIRESSQKPEWRAYVEWEPIDGLKVRTNVEGPESSLRRSSFFSATRAPGLDPSYISTTMFRRDRSASIRVEYRRLEHFEIVASVSTQPRNRTEEFLIPYGDTTGSQLTTETASAPRATLRFRFYN